MMAIDLRMAYLCVNCDCIVRAVSGGRCEVCGSGSLLSIARCLEAQRSSPPGRSRRAGASGVRSGNLRVLARGQRRVGSSS